MRWLVRISLILVVVVGLVVGVLLLLPGDKIASLAADQIKARTGRDVNFGTDVKVTLWPVLGVETGAVTVGNAEWASNAPMLTADALSIGVAAAPLLSGEVQIKRVIAQNPVLRLEEAGGRQNWDFSAPSTGQAAQGGASAAPTAEPFGVTLERLELRDARLIHVKDGKTDLDFAGVTLKARWPAPTAPLEVEASLAIGDESVDVAMTLPDLPGFAAGRVTDMTFALTAPETSVSYSGKVSSAGELAGEAKLTSDDTTRMLSAFGQAGVSLPKGLGQVAEISSQVIYTQDGKLALRGLTAALDQNRFSGNADLMVADPPRVTARLSTGTLDLTGLSAPDEGNASSTGASVPVDGWSKDAIDASALALANGSIRLTVEAIKTSTLDLGPSDLTLELERSRGVLKLSPVSVFGGTVTGQLVANNRNGLSVGGNLQMNRIEAQEALVNLADIDRLSGKLNGTLEFLGVGQSEDAIMRSLSGQGGLQMGRGVISGLDLDGLMGTGSGSGGTTVFNSLTASFTMQGGNLDNRDLLLQLDNYRADGAGRVGLGTRDIDYLFTPVALRANAGQGLAVPVRVVGPWADPAIKPDLSQVIEAAAGVEIDKIEQEAKDRALEKLGEELDTTVTEDQDIEELIKDRLEDEAKKGVLKLFGLD